MGAPQIKKMNFDTGTSLVTGGICPDPMIIGNFNSLLNLIKKNE
jgi:hypothetical protein